LFLWEEFSWKDQIHYEPWTATALIVGSKDPRLQITDWIQPRIAIQNACYYRLAVAAWRADLSAESNKITVLENFLEWSKAQGHNNFPTKEGVFKEHQDEPEDSRAIYEQAWVQWNLARQSWAVCWAIHMVRVLW
jgi:hypothetical protein